MARVAPAKTRYEGVWKRELPRGTVYDYRYTDASGSQQWGPRGVYLTADAARAARAERQAQVRGGETPKAPMTLAAFSPEWIERKAAEVARGELRASTLKQYRADLAMVEAILGSKQLARITVEDVERMADTLSARGLSGDTVKRAQGTLGQVLGLAEKWRRIPFNPVRHADKPKTRRRSPVLPTLADIHRLRENAPSESDGRLIEFLALSGLRPSEAFGLRWPNVDLTPGAECARVVEQVYEGERVDSTKTRAGSREVILAPSAAALLNEQALALQIDGRTDLDGPVFPSPKGTAWRSSNFNRRVWQPTRDAAAMPGLLLYTLRYWHVSQVRASGLPASITEQMVGHTDDRTHRGYTRPVEGQEAVIRAALAVAFGEAT